MEKKIDLGIVFGGQSGEHEVSRASACNVIEVIDKEKYDITLIGITKNGDWKVYTGDYKNIKDGSWEQDTDKSTRIFPFSTIPLSRMWMCSSPCFTDQWARTAPSRASLS